MPISDIMSSKPLHIATVQTKLREPNLNVPVSVTVTTAPDGATSEQFDAHRPSEYPSDVIEAAVREAIMDTPIPSAAADQWRVLIDPAGHPFCITTLLP